MFPALFIPIPHTFNTFQVRHFTFLPTYSRHPPHVMFPCGPLPSRNSRPSVSYRIRAYSKTSFYDNDKDVYKVLQRFLALIWDL